MSKLIPFFANSSDDTHCYQAVLKMICKFYWPNEDYDWTTLDKITKKKEGLWTYSIFGLLWLRKRGLEVKLIEDFNYKLFVEKGVDYYRQEYGDQVAREQQLHSDIAQGQEAASRVLNELPFEKRIPTISDILLLLDQDYLVYCNVNGKVLNHEDGYAGHFVLIFDHSNEYLLLHNPGLPPREHQVVSFADFDKAWGYGGEKAKNIDAVRLIRKN
jgi:hypothetical protein